MKRMVATMIITLGTVLYGCSDDTDTDKTSTDNKTEVVQKEEKEVVQPEVEVEPSGLMMTKDEFVDKYNQIIIDEGMNEMFTLDKETLTSQQSSSVEVTENSDGYLEEVIYTNSGIMPSVDLKVLMLVFNPNVNESNMENIFSLYFDLYGDGRDTEAKDYSGDAMLGDTVYELKTLDVTNKVYEYRISKEK